MFVHGYVTFRLFVEQLKKTSGQGMHFFHHRVANV